MSNAFWINTQFGVIFTKCTEKVTDADVLGHLQAVSQDPHYSPLFRHLVDCIQVSSFEVSSDLIRTIAQRKLFSSGSQCAIVAPQDYIFGMARMFELQHKGSVQVFRDLESAEKWLGLEPSVFPPSEAPDMAMYAKCG